MAEQKNEGPLVNGLAWTLFGLAAMAFALRVKQRLSQSNHFYWDDYIMLFSLVSCLYDLSRERSDPDCRV